MDVAVYAMDVDIGINASVFRSFRLLRVFKLLRSWRGLRQLLQVKMCSASPLGVATHRHGLLAVLRK